MAQPTIKGLKEVQKAIKDLRWGKGAQTEISYGTKYALPVHEIPPPPAKSVGGRSATHAAPTQWKYLEQPFKAHSGNLAEWVAKDMARRGGDAPFSIQAFNASMLRKALQIFSDSQKLVPVEFGRLRQSGTVSQDGKTKKSAKVE